MALIGFTGTRSGMTDLQKKRVKQMLGEFVVSRAHHGDCLGADKEFHDLAREAEAVRVVIHPPTDDKLRAFCRGGTMMQALPYLDRNKGIVDSVDVLIAAPESAEIERSGTWATIRYAKKDKAVGVIIVTPDGKIEVQNKRLLTRLKKKKEKNKKKTT